MKLPPGQQRVHGFPRFGSHLHLPPPEVPANPAIEVAGVVTPFSILLTDVAKLPQVDVTADFHCVGGWSATNLRWQGVGFSTFYHQIVEPALPLGLRVTHLVFCGLDGYRVVVTLEDALEEKVLLADRLNGQALSGDHGAPLRLVSPNQYGFINAKHVCRIEVHTAAQRDTFAGHVLAKLILSVFDRHPRARVWNEERHRYLPGRLVRPIGRTIVAATMPLSARGSRGDATSSTDS